MKSGSYELSQKLREYATIADEKDAKKQARTAQIQKDLEDMRLKNNVEVTNAQTQGQLAVQKERNTGDLQQTAMQNVGAMERQLSDQSFKKPLMDSQVQESGAKVGLMKEQTKGAVVDNANAANNLRLNEKFGDQRMSDEATLRQATIEETLSRAYDRNEARDYKKNVEADVRARNYLEPIYQDQASIYGSLAEAKADAKFVPPISLTNSAKNEFSDRVLGPPSTATSIGRMLPVVGDMIANSRVEKAKTVAREKIPDLSKDLEYVRKKLRGQL